MKTKLTKIYGILLCIVIAAVATILGGANIAGVKLDVVGAPVFAILIGIIITLIKLCEKKSTEVDNPRVRHILSNSDFQNSYHFTVNCRYT